MKKVRILNLPKAAQGLEVNSANSAQFPWPAYNGVMGDPNGDVRNVLNPIDRSQANVEVEKGEEIVTSLNGDGVPEKYKAGGQPHSRGGTPLNLPDDSYVFSKDKSMKIKDPEILLDFGYTKPPKGGITPAEIARKYNLNKIKKELINKDQDKRTRNTLEMMITNYTLKLGKLALIQESMKGFPKGVPYIAMPYLELMGFNAEDFNPVKEEMSQGIPTMQRGGSQESIENYHKNLGTQSKQNQSDEIKTEWSKPHQRYLFYKLLPDGSKQYAYTHNGQTADEHLKEKREQAKQSQSSPTPAVAPTRQSRPTRQKLIKTVPPLTYDKSNDKEGFDSRLSPKSNAKYNALSKLLTENKEIRTAIFDAYREAALDSKYRGKKISDTDWRNISVKTEDEVINTFLKYQKQNFGLFDLQMELAALGIDMYDKQYGWDSGDAENSMTYDVLGKRGFGADDITRGTDLATAQLGANAIVAVKGQEEFKELLKDFNIRTKGGTYQDKGNVIDPVTGKPTTMSVADAFAGDNTNQFIVDNDLGEPEIAKAEETKPEAIKPNEIGEGVTNDGKSPWWLQDIIQTAGAFGDMGRIKRHQPWQAIPDVDYIDPTFVSPERELSAIAEQTAIGADSVAQFTGPQAFNSRFSQLSGKAGAAAADTLSRYNNLNIGIANDAEVKNTDIYNAHSMDLANSATALHDKQTAVNQNFDNAKAKSRENLRKSYIEGITNSVDAYNVNQLSDQYKIDPTTGGHVRFKGNNQKIKPIKPMDYVKEFSEFAGAFPNMDSRAITTLYLKLKGLDNTKDNPRSFSQYDEP